MFGAEHEHPVAAHVHCAHHGVGNGADEAFTCATSLAVDVMGCLAREDGDGTDIGWHTTIDAERLPGIALFVFGDAVAIFAGMAEAAFVEDAGDGAADIH